MVGYWVTLCSAVTSPTGAFACSFKVPVAKSATYYVNATDSTPIADTASRPFQVTTNLSVALSRSGRSADVGLPGRTLRRLRPEATLRTAAYAWDFGDGSNATGYASQVSHAYSHVGDYTLTVTVTDEVGSTASDTTAILVNADPVASTPVASPPSVDVGQETEITSIASFGTGNFSYVWLGLPTACVGTIASVSCRATVFGVYSVMVTVTDTAGFSITSDALSLVVYADPVVAISVSSLPGIDFGQSVVLTTAASLGSGGYAYAWSGLPPGCEVTNASVACSPTAWGTFRVAVTVTDSNDESVTSDAHTLVVAAPLVANFSISPASLTAGSSAEFTSQTQQWERAFHPRVDVRRWHGGQRDASLPYVRVGGDLQGLPPGRG